MTSKAVSNSSKEKHSDNHKMVVIDIFEKLEKLPANEPQNCYRVCVSRVLKSMSSVKPEAFIPQFVGLGPYHHSDPNLIMTDELKLGVAKRVLKVHNRDLFLQNFDLANIQALYHADVNFSYDSHTLLYILTVDGLFLLALLHSSVVLEREYSSYYIFTRKRYGMPLVNAAGVELTMDGIIRDVFMVDNQIPTHVLKQINRNSISSDDEIQQVDTDLGSAMLRLCEALCPLVNVKRLSKDPEAYDHLLDLMYHLVEASELEPKSESESEPLSEFEPDLPHYYRPRTIRLMKCMIMIAITVVISFWYFVAVFWRVIFGLFSSLGRMVQSVTGSLPNFFNFFKHFLDIFHNAYRNTELVLVRESIEQIKESTSGFIQWMKSTKREEDARPSATELHKVGIQLQPAEGGISSIKFDEENCLFYLPSIKLDFTSEFIITNLVAYESLTKSNCLIFTWYIELMSSLIHSAEDVKVIVQQKIIKTQLSDEAVLQLFNGMSKLIRSTKIPKLEEEITKVNAKFKVKWSRAKIPIPVPIPCLTISVLIAFLIIVIVPVLAITRPLLLYCAFNPTKDICKSPDAGDIGRNNNFMSSM